LRGASCKGYGGRLKVELGMQRREWAEAKVELQRVRAEVFAMVVSEPPVAAYRV